MAAGAVFRQHRLHGLFKRLTGGDSGENEAKTK